MIREKIKFFSGNNDSVAEKNIIFISYRHIDAGYRDKILKLLKDLQGISIWYDDYLSAGEFFDYEIQEVLMLSDCIVQLVTKNYFEQGSYTMNREVPLAREMGLKVIAVLCDDIPQKIYDYLQNNADYICSANDASTVAQAVQSMNQAIANQPPEEQFFRLAKRIHTWYITPAEMFILAKGYKTYTDSAKYQNFPENLTEDVAKHYAQLAALSGIPEAEKLVQEWETHNE